MSDSHPPESWPPGMKIVNGHLARSLRDQGMLKTPNDYGYLHLAAEIERPHPLKKNSAQKTALLGELKRLAEALAVAESAGVRRADVFDAFVIPPGARAGRKVIEKAGYDVHVAAFDVAVLVECHSPEAALEVRQSDAFGAIRSLLEKNATCVHAIAARNAKRIDEVDKTRNGVFLFNYFFAANAAEGTGDGDGIVLAVWEYTAGWFTACANLTNSTLLEPLPGERSEYAVINHCRWDRKIDVFPHLVFRPSIRRFVLANFTANGIVAMPILYHLA
ncbi:MAG: hypothetical protein R3174_05375 [Gammaproteobacteria bacterium]|nr:hypothetical protein [Gammaproteobacteria bacterium]